MKKLSNTEKLDLLIEDLGQWMDGNDYNGSLEYAYNNGYHLHAASLWMSTGCVSDEVYAQIEGVKIDHKEEMKEIEQLCSEAFLYICPDCNHASFMQDDEGEKISCESCNGEMTIDKDSQAA